MIKVFYLYRGRLGGIKNLPDNAGPLFTFELVTKESTTCLGPLGVKFY
jgi:hypothetical protein